MNLISRSASITVWPGYGEETMAVLLKKMGDRHGQFCVVPAGYQDEMIAILS